ncbi:hypothetical protein MNBD_GAMMA16-157 [hydrothermal vent metagenome]|uniref:Haem-binding uptake Tiki superfamily ChaN domain-containing protein n=1 Tax=hydrothermal vent metagenome TaxID=652676 RepID=A0A3B0Z1J0_9ZZZZ
MIFTSVKMNRLIFSKSRLVLLLLLMSLIINTSIAQDNHTCIEPKTWLIPASGHAVDKNSVLNDVLKHRLIMLGEHHQNTEHHSWHLDMISDIDMQKENMELAIEMLPRSAQPVLDQWVSGKLSEAEFIQKSNWNHYWFYDVELYLPVLRYAKEKGIKIHALNVERSLFSAVSEQGWEKIPDAKREGLSKPVAGTKPYLIQLAKSFRRHQPMAHKELKKEVGEKFARFVEVQLLWDRAMAEGINKALNQPHKPVVVSIMGSGHMMNGNGAIHQLAAINDLTPVTLIPWDDHLKCDNLKPGFATYVYGGQG